MLYQMFKKTFLSGMELLGIITILFLCLSIIDVQFGELFVKERIFLLVFVGSSMLGDFYRSYRAEKKQRSEISTMVKE